jgi:5-bromo-4-chloroindolyl phosphate hydrolysis protein
MDGKKESLLRTILPGIIGGAVFIFFAFILGIGGFSLLDFFISLGLGVAAFVGSGFLFPTANKNLEIVVDGITKEKYNEILSQGQAKLKILGSFITQAKDVEVKKKIKEISDVVEKIFEDIQKDPKDIKPAREFLTYYLDTTINILTRYTDISSQGIRSKKIDDMLAKVEGLLDAIKQAFEKQLEKLLSDDILDLDSDLKVLEQTIKTEMIE